MCGGGWVGVMLDGDEKVTKVRSGKNRLKILDEGDSEFSLIDEEYLVPAVGLSGWSLFI